MYSKTTVANLAADQLPDCLALDLDVCVPQWMRDNFNKGIYPTLEERQAFANNACNYVDRQICKIQMEDKSNANVLSVLVSFSFVNTDLRDAFRQHFPHAKWALVDTTNEEAARRIQHRQDHFYKGAPQQAPPPDEREASKKVALKKEEKSSEWNFAPVTFEHTALPGMNSVQDNAQLVVELVQRQGLQ